MSEQENSCSGNRRKILGMDFPSFFLTSNIFKFFIFLGIILFANACSVPTREYLYPDVNTLEQQRLCQLVSFRKTSQYLVADRKIMPMKKDEIMAPVQDTESDLQKGVYFCGIFQARYYDCSPYQTIRLDVIVQSPECHVLTSVEFLC